KNHRYNGSPNYRSGPPCTWLPMPCTKTTPRSYFAGDSDDSAWAGVSSPTWVSSTMPPVSSNGPFTSGDAPRAGGTFLRLPRHRNVNGPTRLSVDGPLTSLGRPASFAPAADQTTGGRDELSSRSFSFSGSRATGSGGEE